MSTATLTAEPLPQIKITGRALSLVGVTTLTIAAAQFVSLYGLTATGRTAIGLIVAAVMIAGGQFITRFGRQGWWSGTMLMGGGYGLAGFFVQPTSLIGGIPAWNSPYLCWALSLCLGLAAILHGSRNSLLRWLALPFTLLVTGQCLMQALASTQTLSIAGLSFKLSAAASVLGMLWWCALSALYKHLELSAKDNGRDPSARLLFMGAHEALFALAALNALALPKFCGTLASAPVWWSLEMPVLLAICWRSGSFIKHSLVMAVWSVSAVLVVAQGLGLSTAVRMSVPAAGLLMALSYRYIKSNWPQKQKVVGYSVYLYASALVSLAVPLMRLSRSEITMCLLVGTGALLVLALVLRDRVLHYLGCVVAVGALGLFAIQWHTWHLANLGMVVAGCYAFSVVYGRIQIKGGWAKSPYCPVPGSFTFGAREAQALEVEATVAGYAALLAGSYFLFPNPYNTVAWGIEAFSLIAFGFITERRWHRASGLLAMAIASAKLTIIDLSGADTLWRTVASFGAVGICSLAAGLFYLREFGRRNRSGS